MKIVLAVCGVTFASFCVWLGVRIYNRRERWAKRTAWALAAFLTLYPLSIGPAIWVYVHLVPESFCPAYHRVVSVVYFPMEALAQTSGFHSRAALEYQDLWASQDELKERWRKDR